MSSRIDHRNRQERRHPVQGPAPIKDRQLSIDYGHNGHFVVMRFTFAVDNMVLTERQVDEMIGGLQVAKEKLILHKAAAANEGGPGNG